MKPGYLRRAQIELAVLTVLTLTAPLANSEPRLSTATAPGVITAREPFEFREGVRLIGYASMSSSNTESSWL
jgi:hypothetical protein